MFYVPSEERLWDMLPVGGCAGDSCQTPGPLRVNVDTASVNLHKRPGRTAASAPHGEKAPLPNEPQRVASSEGGSEVLRTRCTLGSGNPVLQPVPFPAPCHPPGVPWGNREAGSE